MKAMYVPGGPTFEYLFVEILPVVVLAERGRCFLLEDDQ